MFCPVHSEVIMWSFKENEDDEDIQYMAAAGFIFLANKKSEQKKKRTRSKRKILT
jgi:hypothetical protein